MASKLVYRRSDAALFADVGSDVVALNVDKGHCYGMESVAAVVWNLLARPSSLDELCDSLIERYDVEPEICRKDIAALVGQLEHEGLVQGVIR